ncbi:hypothetical protein EN745_13555 [Mesorhizobium sp. M4A.F.Ca.ET.022.05.2.1]|uniref:hypothetical protein n=1 Tax=Mesorhizobium sp. M4A.F.Ca.ET.022.05.2.1 TaxID=2496653 RepID=UPI000FCC795F|nr:hypothetical protein [Mesorhizobium sp. M4A.F.Ca.ET.022.05.2.1]RVC80198.1 hypothetical protein EN745_13555 [Mesorhizobium sp. M4A.F.Ca.ET.022.05.2.1]
MNAHLSTLRPFACPKGMDPRTWRQAIEKELNSLFDKATALITALDVMEADSEDLEDDDREDIDERELDEADYEDSGDEHEPSLGWSAARDRHLALMDVGTAADVAFFDGEQDAGDEPEHDYHD